MSDEVENTPADTRHDAHALDADAQPSAAEAPGATPVVPDALVEAPTEPVADGDIVADERGSTSDESAVPDGCPGASRDEPDAAVDEQPGQEAAAGEPLADESVALETVLQMDNGGGVSTAEVPVDASEPVADPQLKAVVEALIFASPEPLTPKMLFKLLESEPREDVELALASLRGDYERHGGVQMVEVAGGYQIVTRPEMHEWVRRLFHERKTQKLSVQALETLAVIAYKQPVTGPEIAEIRGVNTGGVLSTLLDRHLIKIAGRKAVVGRPFLYATTREFLIRFGLRDLGDLPKVEDLADVLGFEPPAGLADSGPSEGRLPLEEPAPAEQDTPDEEPGGGERVH